jgi:hypothetical protein
MTTMHLSQRSSILISHSVRLVRVIASTSSNTIQAHHYTQFYTSTHAHIHSRVTAVSQHLCVDCARVLSFACLQSHHSSVGTRFTAQPNIHPSMLHLKSRLVTKHQHATNTLCNHDDSLFTIAQQRIHARVHTIQHHKHTDAFSLSHSHGSAINQPQVTPSLTPAADL